VNIERAKKTSTSFRLTPVAKHLLERIASYEGITRTDALELILRQSARDRKIPIPKKEL